MAEILAEFMVFRQCLVGNWCRCQFRFRFLLFPLYLCCRGTSHMTRRNRSNKLCLLHGFSFVVFLVTVYSPSGCHVCLSIHLPVYFVFSVCPSLCFFSVRRFVSLSTRLSVSLSICLSVFLSVFLSVCLSICLSVFLFVCLSVHLFVFQSVYLSVILSVCLFHSSVFPVHPSACPIICLSICLSFSLIQPVFFRFGCMLSCTITSPNTTPQTSSSQQ